MYQIIDGKALANEIHAEIKAEIEEFVMAGHRRPRLGIVIAGNNSASETYVEGKIKACERVGISSEVVRLNAEISFEGLKNEILKLNRDPEMDGFIVQLPLPSHIIENQIVDLIDPEKDVDGSHPLNSGLMALGMPCFLPATPYGIMLLLEKYKIETSGKHCVILGRSHIVGSPMSILLSRNSNPGNCTVTLCHSKTKDLKSYTSTADILIVALGKPEFITSEMVKKGAVVIDVGIHRTELANDTGKFRIVGDVKFDEVAPLSSYISPVPGGVGAMTIASLLKNTLQAARKRAGL
jgi:methylenetetrahydrofolate dehydrogenase (NADP+)/methenyltetrahydrofolate cyclohydrolase